MLIAVLVSSLLPSQMTGGGDALARVRTTAQVQVSVPMTEARAAWAR